MRRQTRIGERRPFPPTSAPDHVIQVTISHGSGVFSAPLFTLHHCISSHPAVSLERPPASRLYLRLDPDLLKDAQTLLLVLGLGHPEVGLPRGVWPTCSGQIQAGITHTRKAKSCDVGIASDSGTRICPLRKTHLISEVRNRHKF